MTAPGRQPINIQAERMNRGLSRRQAAAAIGIARATLIAAEEGRGIHEASAKRIADFYGAKVTDLWPVVDEDETDLAVA